MLPVKSHLLGLAVCLACPAYANLVDNGSFTTDTRTGLDWLDVPLTLNQSVNYVLSQMGQGGLYEGWRYATGDEVASLWDSAGGSGTYVGYSAENNGLYNSLSALWGPTFGTVSSGYINATVADLVNPERTTDHHLAILRDWDDYDPNVATEDFADMRWHTGVDYVYADRGSALVRAASIASPVPEPATVGMWLVGALVGVFASRRRPLSNVR